MLQSLVCIRTVNTCGRIRNRRERSCDCVAATGQRPGGVSGGLRDSAKPVPGPARQAHHLHGDCCGVTPDRPALLHFPVVSGSQTVKQNCDLITTTSGYGM